MKVSIRDLRKEEVLLELYNNANNFGIAGDNPLWALLVASRDEGSLASAKAFVEKEDISWIEEVDLGAGSKRLKVDISGEEIDTENYDAYHGKGCGERAIAKVSERDFFFGANTKSSIEAEKTTLKLYDLFQQQAKEKVNPDNMVTLRTGEKVSETLYKTAMQVLTALYPIENIENRLIFNAIVIKCQSGANVTDTATLINKGRGLVDANGEIPAETKKIILAAVEGMGLRARLVEPLASVESKRKNTL